ncbi:integrase, catalytic region, zinc finger, CCHC-type containing protein, partial [Tanacetum coccineum]
LKPLPKIDPKDKGKKVLKEEFESDSESEGVDEVERKRFLPQQRAVAIRSRPPTRTQLRNQMMTYLKYVGGKKHADLKNKNFEEIQVLYKEVKRSNKKFIVIGSAKDEREIKEMNEESKDPKKKRLKKRVVNETSREEDTAKVPAEQEVTEQGTKKIKNGHVKMIARKRPRPQPDDDSDDKHRKCLRIVTFDSTIDSEIMETKSFVSKLHKVSSPDGDYLIVYRVNGHFMAFNYLMEIVSWRLYEACRVCILDLKDGTVIYMLVERRYPLSKELLQRMLDLGLEVEEESTAALHLVRFIKQQLNEEHQELTSPEANGFCEELASPGSNSSWLSIHLVVYNEELAIPEQTATGKGISNPLMAGSLPKTTKPTPPMLERGSYIPWASRFRRYINRKRENRKWLNKALDEGHYQFEMFITNNSTVLKLQTAEDLQGDALLHYDAEMELMNLILLSIPNNIYNSVDACTSAKDIWKRVERLMRGTIQNKVDRETRFTNEFDQFVAEPEEALVSVYNRFAQLMNDLERNDMHFPIQFKKLVNVSRANKLEKSHDPLALVAHTGSSSKNTSSYYVIHPMFVVDYEDEYQQDDVYTNSEDPLTSAMLNSGNAGRNNRRAYVQEEIVEGLNAPNKTENVQRNLRTSSSGNTSTVQCYNCSGKGHYARNYPKPRIWDSKYFMKQILLAKQNEDGVILTDEQNDFFFA